MGGREWKGCRRRPAGGEVSQGCLVGWFGTVRTVRRPRLIVPMNLQRAIVVGGMVAACSMRRGVRMVFVWPFVWRDV